MTDDARALVDRLGLIEPRPAHLARPDQDQAALADARRSQRQKAGAGRKRWPLIEETASGLGLRAPHWPPARGAA